MTYWNKNQITPGDYNYKILGIDPGKEPGRTFNRFNAFNERLYLQSQANHAELSETARLLFWVGSPDDRVQIKHFLHDQFLIEISPKEKDMSVYRELHAAAESLAAAEGGLRKPEAARFQVLCERIEADQKANKQAHADLGERIDGLARVRGESASRLSKRVATLEEKQATPAGSIASVASSQEWADLELRTLMAAALRLPTGILFPTSRARADFKATLESKQSLFGKDRKSKIERPFCAEAHAFNNGWDARKLSTFEEAANGRDCKRADFVGVDKDGAPLFVGDYVYPGGSPKPYKIHSKLPKGFVSLGCGYDVAECSRATYCNPVAGAAGVPQAPPAPPPRGPQRPDYIGQGNCNEAVLIGDICLDVETSKRFKAAGRYRPGDNHGYTEVIKDFGAACLLKNCRVTAPDAFRDPYHPRFACFGFCGEVLLIGDHVTVDEGKHTFKLHAVSGLIGTIENLQTHLGVGRSIADIRLAAPAVK